MKPPVQESYSSPQLRKQSIHVQQESTKTQHPAMGGVGGGVENVTPPAKTPKFQRQRTHDLKSRGRGLYQQTIETTNPWHGV